MCQLAPHSREKKILRNQLCGSKGAFTNYSWPHPVVHLHMPIGLLSEHTDSERSCSYD